ncbi:hypothetical protein DM02DRAFT_613594 [Periconia macrospinosa]|uniref:Uncharacterized protein n=1 Tax=Periconia macrospinosa TaxID=97972 RepID=A0A2V1DVU5_9PLEO|nr:hypothetical protein DM02DRAFT_613594 [Periconia macrospinosa]
MRPQFDPDNVTHPIQVARSALQLGAGAAVPGLIVGATAGTIRTQTPVLFSLVSGAQWFAIGTTFWGVRSSILQQDGLRNWYYRTRGIPLVPRQDLDPSPQDRIRASTIAGAFTGLSLGLLFRGPTNAAHGTFMFSLFGWAGQHGYNYLDQRNSVVVQEEHERREQGVRKDTLLQRFAKSKWSPMSILSDEDYEKLIGEKILVVEADIALIDDKIEALRRQQREAEAEASKKQQQQQDQKK